MLTIDDYDRAEADAVTKSSYPAIRSFRPAAFALANFPVRVTKEIELIRYSDIMSELDSDNFFSKNLYSQAEADLMISVSQEVEQLTTKLFGRAVQPYKCLFSPITVARAVSALSKRGPLTIYEIGPGSGYLGAYLIKNGLRFGNLTAHHNYRAIDNTQALYLWQDRFFSHCSGGNFTNLVTDPTEPDDIKENAASIPWWRFADFFKHPPKADIVICDAAMGEMDSFAANYVIRVAAEMLKSSKVGAFLFRHIGEQRINSMTYIEKRLKRAGFVGARVGEVSVYSLHRLDLPRKFAPIGGETNMRTADKFLQIDKKKLLPSYEYFDFIRLLE